MAGEENVNEQMEEAEKKEKKKKGKNSKEKEKEKKDKDSKEKEKEKEKKGKDSKEKEKTKDPAKLRLKVGKIDAKIDALKAKKEEIIRQLYELEIAAASNRVGT